MNNLSVRDRMILIAIALCVLIYSGYCYLWMPANTNMKKLAAQETELKGQIGDQTPLDSKIQQLESDNSLLVKRIADTKASHSSRTLNKNDFLTYLSNECSSGDVELIRFNDLGSAEDSGAWKEQFDFELRGSLSSLTKICEAIDKTGVKYSVGGMSLRQNDNYSYLERFFDADSKLDWYKDETPPPEEKDETAPEPTPGSYDESLLLPSVAVPAIPEPEMPRQVPQPTTEPTPTPTPEKPKDENITDRLNRLLQKSGYNIRKDPINFVFLTNDGEGENEADLPSSGVSNEVMRLNITVEFIMYTDPKNGINSFAAKGPEV